MGCTRIKYIMGLSDESEAAKLYDVYALFLQGPKAKTNFNYTATELEQLVSLGCDLSDSVDNN